EIKPGQVIGLKLPVFLAIVAGCINTEAPIRGYTETSRAYLLPIAPRMAQFVGGIVDDNTGQLVETGLWEKEESRHTPALRKIYRHLSGSQLSLEPHLPRSYKEQDCATAALYRHGLHRIATEYGATGLYLWLMGHTTGQLQAVFGELLIDEINHTTKFWGYGRWLYPDASFFKTGSSLFAALRQKMQQPQIRGSLIHTLHRMTRTLHWSEWSLANQSLLLYTLGRIMQRFLIWQRGLTHEHLAELFVDTE
ncbi:MAG: ferritin-like domain-containing protein, partial [Cyanobacteria bacterium P01_H01_bin.15]